MPNVAPRVGQLDESCQLDEYGFMGFPAVAQDRQNQVNRSLNGLSRPRSEEVDLPTMLKWLSLG